MSATAAAQRRIQNLCDALKVSPTASGDKRVVLITHVLGFMGKMGCQALVAAGEYIVCAHDESFGHGSEGAAFAADVPGVQILKATADPESIIDEVKQRFGRLDVLVSNDDAPPERSSVEDTTVDQIR
jgi:NAD(P)-dependent dehydrogenase (short-subunit alcohol dehydrogenase family)